MKRINQTIRYASFALIFLLTISISAQDQTSSFKLVTGVITFDGTPLNNVNVKVQRSTRGSTSNSDGSYEIKVRNGEMVKFSYVGFKPIDIIIEDVTEVLNVEMVQLRNDLDAAVVNARKRTGSAISNVKEEEVMDVDLTLPGGTFNPMKSGMATAYIPGKLIQNGLPLVLTLNGKVSGLTTKNGVIYVRGAIASVIVDGNPTSVDNMPVGDFVHDIFVLKSSAVVYIRTINNYDLIQAKKKQETEKYKNQDYYTEDAVAVESTMSNATSKPNMKSKPVGPIKEIKGRIGYLDAPLANVNIIIEGSDRGTKTNRRGKYKLEAREGEVIIFSYVGFKTVQLVVEDITEELSFDMIPATNELDEVVLKVTNRNGKQYEFSKKAESVFNTSAGKFDPRKAGYSVGYVDGNALNLSSTTLLEALTGKVAGLYVNPVTNELKIRGGTGSITNDVPPLFEIDGMVVTGIPSIDVTNIKDVRVLKSLSSLTRYGSQGAGGVIVITTKSGDFTPGSGRKSINEEFANDNYYNNDATTVDKNLLASETANNLKAQLAVERNPELLKALAYQFEALDLNPEAREAYQRVYSLRPNYAQSYRDLANSYIQNEQFKRGWRMYMAYFNQGFKGNEEGIGELVYDEMEWLFFQRGNQTQISQSFQPKSEDLSEFRNDVRFVFEWNTSEAEFDLEFVSPDRRAYTFEHTLATNQELINEEKRKGYSSKRFFIEDVGDGEWLINLTYKGNKKDAPTYFKLTTFYHWGKHNETMEVRVYKLNDSQKQKLQLLKVNKQVLLSYK